MVRGQDDFTGIRFVAASLKGSRSFRVDSDGWLTGVIHRARWFPDWNQAECLTVDWLCDIQQTRAAGRIPSHDHTNISCKQGPRPCGNTPNLAPSGSDRCGFYGYFSGSMDYASQSNVSGVVEAAGRVVVGPRGFRAARARVTALYLPPYTNDTTLLFAPITYRIGAPAPVGARGRGVSEATEELLRANYPTVPFYDDLAEMLSNHPTDEPLTKENQS